MILFLLCAVIVQGALGSPQDQWGNWNHHGQQVPATNMGVNPQLQMILAAQQAQQLLNQQLQAQGAQPSPAQIQALIHQRQIQELIQQQQIQELVRQQLMQQQQQQWRQELAAFQNGLSPWQNVPQQLFQQGLQPGRLGNFQQRLEQKHQILGQLWNNRPGLLGLPGQNGEEGRWPHHHWAPFKPGRQPIPQQPPQQQPELQKPEEPNNPEQTQSVDEVEEVPDKVETAVDSTVQTDSTPALVEAKPESETQADVTVESSTTNTEDSEPEVEIIEEAADE